MSLYKQIITQSEDSLKEAEVESKVVQAHADCAKQSAHYIKEISVAKTELNRAIADSSFNINRIMDAQENIARLERKAEQLEAFTAKYFD